MKFVPMEPLLIYTTNGGNFLAVEPVRDRTELIGRKHVVQLNDFVSLIKFLDGHFEKVGSNRAT